MDFQIAIKEISKYTKSKFPNDAVEYISSNKEMFEEFFIETIQSYANNIDLYDKGKDLHFSALLFLGQFQSQLAFPCMLDLLRTLPYTEENDQPLGDGITDVIPCVLAACFNGNLGLTNDLLCSESSYLFSRVAVLQMVEVLLCLEKLTVEEVNIFYEKLVADLVAQNKNDEFILMCIDNLASISLEFCIDLCTKYNIDLDWVQKEIDYLQKNDAPRPFYISEKERTIKSYEDVTHNGIRCIQGWSMFSTAKDFHTSANHGLGSYHDLTNIMRTHLGRNDPCFCGSGKKYKKCCLQ